MFSKAFMDVSTLPVAEIRKIFRRHRGASAQLSRELKVNRSSLSIWLRHPYPSKRIDAAVRQRVVELLAQENRQRKKPPPIERGSPHQ